MKQQLGAHSPVTISPRASFIAKVLGLTAAGVIAFLCGFASVAAPFNRPSFTPPTSQVAPEAAPSSQAPTRAEIRATEAPTLSASQPPAPGSLVTPSLQTSPQPSLLVAPATSPSSATPSPVAGGGLVGLRVDIIDVGQGDSILVRASNGTTVLIDGGEASSGVTGYLRSQNVQRIDLMIATHPNSDHIGGLVEVLGAIPVDEVATNGQEQTTLTFERFIDAITSAGAVYLEPKRGDTLAVGSLRFQVLNPDSASGFDMNNQSLVLRLAYANVAFLFTGDAGRDAERSMLAANADLHSDILKVGHHGSRAASSPEFLDAVRPKVAIYSAGAGNSYGHPDPETLQALSAVGAAIYGTDKDGTVVITTDGATYQVSTERGAGLGIESPTESPPIAAAAPLADGTPGAPEGLSLAILRVTSPVAPGGMATLQAISAPGAHCTITVYYKSGPSKASGLLPQNADDQGNVTWTWRVSSQTTLGSWKIVVSAALGGSTVTAETLFEVAK
jgi:competence protein ComEC